MSDELLTAQRLKKCWRLRGGTWRDREAISKIAATGKLLTPYRTVKIPHYGATDDPDWDVPA